ncbi:hypothetical protein HYH03_004906 [Edaphochlamys debaryana]|uniref:EML-like second beta-propeller domain-containing protein n=1 Tax=Edaphochlamys debaryana TaxID=47281 RepID=A0A836C2R6_9CHLO|nr:hypothetical protein HYH03_004906 [Edaphochlamys debaryana]|eukprot:KAG2496899.1 hypothetical protein HYH03_004906 [Edaphochlamys debaryana]
MAAVLGGGGYGSRRPASAPRERGGDTSLAVRARVEEKRLIKEAGLWGQELRAPKRDLPAFWSIRTHGQPFNDERLGAGATNFFRLTSPAGLNGGGGDSVGPATLQQSAMRKSLETGRVFFTSLHELTPLPPGVHASQPLSDADREYLLSRLTPYQRIHALYHCLDKDQMLAVKEDGWMPWPLAILNRDSLVAQREGRAKVPPPKYDYHDWNGGGAQRDMLMRLATQELEYMMRRHLKYMSDRECHAARAPAALEKDILRQAFWRVDPQKTGSVSIQQFLQVWQNILRLMEYEDSWVKTKDAKGKTRQEQVLKPLRVVLLDRNMAAAVFVKYGFDKDGLMPYVVYINALCETPSRLLGHEVVLNKSERGKNGLEDDMDIALCLGNAKIDYRYCKQGVFPPGEFTSQMGRRSFKPPKAHMWLDHVYGYAGMLEYTLQSNIFYTHNTGKPLNPDIQAAVVKRIAATQGGATVRPEGLKCVEFVYYTGAVGVVFNKEKFDAGLPCQRYFFGHNNDIQCLAMHPSRRWVATGQQKCEGPTEVPYACVWDVDHCMQLQRLDHGRDERGVIALCFSGDQLEGKGGELLLTVTSDDKHTIHVWRWLPHHNKFINAHYIPGWYLGPEKKILPLKSTGEMYYHNPEGYPVGGGARVDDLYLGAFPFDLDAWKAEKLSGNNKQFGAEQEVHDVEAILAASREAQRLDAPVFEQRYDWWNDDSMPAPVPGSERGPNPMWSNYDNPDLRVRAEDADGFYFSMRGVKREEGFYQQGAPEDKQRMPHHEQDMNGCNGTPPMVYGMVWNPVKPSDGRRGSEFASYGVKHLKVWIADDQGRFMGTSGSFGTAHIENVLSALYVPAMHQMRSPGDSCLLTGFASGKLGLWVPPYPTRPGSVYTLVRHFDAHAPGKIIALNDGTQVHGGVRALKLRKTADNTLEVLSGGADGCVRIWSLQEVTGARPDGTPNKGVRLGSQDRVFKLTTPTAEFKKQDPPLVVALDTHAVLNEEFLAGTNGCDIWEVDQDPRVLVEGHEDSLNEVAPHPEFPHLFASVCESGTARIWDARIRDVILSADLGYKLTGVAFSNEKLPLRAPAGGGTSKEVVYDGYHLAVSGAQGQLTVMRTDTMQPLVHRNDVARREEIGEMKYSPFGGYGDGGFSGPRMLACAAADLTVYIYRADKNYQLLSKCMGHSGTVTHIDWSLPICIPGTPIDGKFILQSSDTAGDLLHWLPETGKKLKYNMRDVEWYSWSLSVGFDVMGIWPDDSDGTDVNAVDRCRLGAPIYDPFEAEYEESTEAAFHLSEADSADGVSGAGFLVTADDFSTVKLFNYPVVADDAPYKAFRGHASHVTSVRFLADDQIVVSAGGHDRGIYQWRTCGIASGLPPLPVIYEKLGQCNQKAGGDRERAKEMREDLWERLHERARSFRAYERLKLYAMRVAVEEKRVNSMASAVPQPKLPDQMEWGLIPGTTRHYGPVSKTGTVGGGATGAAGSTYSSPAAAKGGATGSTWGGSPASGYGGSASKGPGSAYGGSASKGPGSAYGGSVGKSPGSAYGGSVGKGSMGGGTPRTGGGTPARTPSMRSAAGGGGGGSTYGESGLEASGFGESGLGGPSGGINSPARTPSVRSAVTGRGGPASARAPSVAASEDFDISGEVGSYEPSGVPGRKSAAPSVAGSRPATAAGSRPATATPSFAGGSRPASVAGGSRPASVAGGSRPTSAAPSGRASRTGTPSAMTPRSEAGGSEAGGKSVGGRSGKRYVTDSLAGDDDVPDELFDGDGDEF